MNKPIKHTRQYFDYIECRNFLQEKYGFNERDVAKRFYPEYNAEAPYQDFWHFVLSCCDHIHNESFFNMDNEWLTFAEEDWQRTILEYYLSEFGEGPDREITFWVEW